ncbi:MAG: hemerythrin domain-containing protein [Aquificota bacterium]|nr:hemerythrin domain-containing protein [Aquificota bacterium]
MLIGPEDIQKVPNMFMNAVHEDEIEIINRLYEALKKGDLQEADRLMDELLIDLEDHFSTEEELMREADFFGYPMHKAEHDNMRREFKAVYDSWKDTKDPSAVMRFLEEKMVPWLKLLVAQWDSVTAQHLGD